VPLSLLNHPRNYLKAKIHQQLNKAASPEVTKKHEIPTCGKRSL